MEKCKPEQKANMALFLWCVVVAISCGIARSLTIELPECEPPDYPQWGGYGPRQDFYVTGDVIHYYCDTDTHIGGNYYRRCEDTGSWTGETPMCDSPAIFSSVNQTTTADPEDQNGPERAIDALRSTCSRTKGGKGDHWYGMLATPGELFRVSIFSPKGEASFEVFMIKKNGAKLSCGSKRTNIDYLNWEFFNCGGPNNTDIIGVKIKSLSDAPLQFCEIVAHVHPYPVCVDPHVRIENGRLQLNRKTATLVCDSGYSRSPETRLECIRNGVWNRKSLYCLGKDQLRLLCSGEGGAVVSNRERQWEVGNRGSASDQDP